MSFLGVLQIVDDMKYTVSHVVEPVEKGFAKINKTIHDISENVKRYDERRKSANSKDDSFLIPLSSWEGEFSEAHESLPEGSASDSSVVSGVGKRQGSSIHPFKSLPSRLKRGR